MPVPSEKNILPSSPDPETIVIPDRCDVLPTTKSLAIAFALSVSLSPIITLPAESIRSLSLPAVSTVNVSPAGNLIAVFVSPVWTILSAMEKSVSPTVTVTIPADAGDTFRLVLKSTVAATPTVLPLSLILIPDPDAVTPVNPEPLPMNVVAVTTPD